MAELQENVEQLMTELDESMQEVVSRDEEIDQLVARLKSTQVRCLCLACDIRSTMKIACVSHDVHNGVRQDLARVTVLRSSFAACAGCC